MTAAWKTVKWYTVYLCCPNFSKHLFQWSNQHWTGKIFGDGEVGGDMNSLRPSDAHMRLWNRPSLVQIMACRFLGVMPSPETMLVYCQLELKEQTSLKSNRNSNIFIQEDAFENILCKNGGHLVSVLKWLNHPHCWMGLRVWIVLMAFWTTMLLIIFCV